jgi:mono/diheme cytochrome c family protein
MGRIGAVLAGALGAIIVLALIGLVIIYTGAVNVAATARHAPLTGWVLDTTLRKSVKRLAADVDSPASFDQAAIAAGAGEFKSMCERCHGGPGVKPAEWAEGLTPEPPDLSKAAREWELREVFWIVKHGVKMTAMPSFGETHDDETVWNIAAFVERLPKMTPAEYAAYEEGHGHEAAPHSHASP